MNDPRPYEPPHSNAEPQVFRARASTRYAMVALAGLTIVFAISLAAFAVYSMIPFDGAVPPISIGFSISQVAVGLILVGSAVYWAQFWSKYSIVVGDDFMAREGLPHLVDRRRRIAYSDILRVTRGTRNILKIVPKDGNPLAVGLRGLEGDPTDLIVALRERLPENRFDAGLEASIFEKTASDRLGYIVSAGFILVTVGTFGAMFGREPVLERVAWLEVSGLPNGLRIGQVDTAGDGSIWMVAAGRFEGEEDDLGLVHVRPDGSIVSMAFSRTPALRGSLDRAAETGRAPVDSLAIDSYDRPWLVFRTDRAAYVLDGSEWRQVLATYGGVDFAITDLVRAGDFLWAMIPEHNSLFRIDPDSFEAVAMGPLSWDAESGAVELTATDLRGSADNGGVVFGELSPGRSVFLTLTGDGSIGFATDLLGAPGAATWHARSATPDGQGQFHVLYDSRDVCVDGRRLIHVGTTLADAEWEWREIVYPADCDIDPAFDEIHVDPLGRIWIRPNHGDVMVFPGAGSEDVTRTAEPLAVYSRDNSGYNDGDLVVGSGGHLLGVRGFRPELVALDIGGQQLPNPLPAWFAWYLEYPFVGQFAVLLLMLPLLIAIRRKNSRR